MAKLLRKWRVAVYLVIFVIVIQKRAHLKVIRWTAAWLKCTNDFVELVQYLAQAEYDNHYWLVRERARVLWRTRRWLRESQPRGVRVVGYGDGQAGDR